MLTPDEILKVLNEQDGNGLTALMRACRRGNIDEARDLLEQNASVNIQRHCPLFIGTECQGNGRTALHIACEEGHPDIVELLLQHGADPNIVDEQKATPLMLAQALKRDACVDIMKRANEFMPKPPVVEPLLELPPSKEGVKYVEFIRAVVEKKFRLCLTERDKLKYILLNRILDRLEQKKHLNRAQLLTEEFTVGELSLTWEQQKLILLISNTDTCNLKFALNFHRHQYTHDHNRFIAPRSARRILREGDNITMKLDTLTFLDHLAKRLKKGEKKYQEVMALIESLNQCYSIQTLEDLCAFHAPGSKHNLLGVLMMQRKSKNPEKETTSYKAFCKLFDLKVLIGDEQLKQIRQEILNPAESVPSPVPGGSLETGKTE